jgi:hypothetical protein
MAIRIRWGETPWWLRIVGLSPYRRRVVIPHDTDPLQSTVRWEYWNPTIHGQILRF